MTNRAVVPPHTQPDNDEQLAEQITLLAGQINVANYRLLKLIAQFDQRRGWSGGGTVRSFAAGEISYSKVRAMTRVATPENEDFLLTIARYGTASHVEQGVNKYRGVQRSMDDSHERAQEQARKLVYYQDDDGMWVIHAKLPAEAGSIVVKAIEAVAKPRQEARQERLRERCRDVPAGTVSEEYKVPEPERCNDLMEQTRADALVTISEHFLASSADKGQWQGLKGSERCQVMLHVDINTLREHTNPSNPARHHCQLDDKQWMSPATARRLACDASLVTVLEDEQGKVLNIGRRTRTVPASLGRALALRDRSCRFPGCCESRYVDAHHIRHWADGGETSLDNLVTLCRYHHRQLHQGGFSITVDKTAAEVRLAFSKPSGRRIEDSFFPQFKHVSAEASDTLLRTSAPQVNARTCITRWQGEDCDYGMAVDALLHRDENQRQTSIVTA